MNETFLDNTYFDFLVYKDLKNETQDAMNDFCNYYLDNYKGSNKDNIESLRLFFTKFLKDNHKDSIFISVFNNTLKICIYDSKIDFLAINDALQCLQAFIIDFKDYLND